MKKTEQIKQKINEIEKLLKELGCDPAAAAALLVPIEEAACNLEIVEENQEHDEKIKEEV